MALDTSTYVEAVSGVESIDGQSVPPASDEFDAAGGDHDLDADGDLSVEVTAPGRPSRLVVLAEFAADGHVEIEHNVADDVSVTRTPSQNPDYEVTGGGQVFVSTDPASRDLMVHIRDDTADGTANSVEYGVMAI